QPDPSAEVIELREKVAELVHKDVKWEDTVNELNQKIDELTAKNQQHENTLVGAISRGRGITYESVAAAVIEPQAVERESQPLQDPPNESRFETLVVQLNDGKWGEERQNEMIDLIDEMDSKKKTEVLVKVGEMIYRIWSAQLRTLSF
ncbi:hypothetical protein PMAYCL1PPCAC_20715, partial [Pristionchus mayeri]